MSDEKIPPIGTEKHWEWVRKRAEERAKQCENLSGEGFDDAGLIAGGGESMSSTDAESFPDELGEYTPAERKPKLVKSSKKKD